MTAQTNPATRPSAHSAIPNGPAVLALREFGKLVGRSRGTLARWREKGIIPKQDIRRILGKPYITLEGIERFNKSVLSGRLAGALHGCAAKWQQDNQPEQAAA
jgi:hypothetical protein